MATISDKLLDGRLKLRHLVLVDTLTEQGTVVGAAAALHVTQPVISRRLRELEEVLGVELYERGPRGIVPTEFGEAFTEHARSVLAQLRQAGRHIEEIADARRGRVVVGTHLAGANLLLPRAIAALKRERPTLSVVVREGYPEALLVELTAGRVDLLVGRLTRNASETVHRELLYDESIRIVVGKSHPLATMTEPSVNDVMGYPWILPGAETDLRAELEAFFARHGFDTPAERVEATSFLAVRQLLLETDMVAALPGLIGADDPRLAALPTTLDAVGHRVGITAVRARHLNPGSRALIAALREAAAAMTAS